MCFVVVSIKNVNSILNVPPQLCSHNPLLFSVSEYKDKKQRDCCLEGMSETPLSYNCERRSEFIVDGPECVEAFLHCCKKLEAQRAERKHDSLLLARSKRWGQGKGGKAALVIQ